MSDRKRFYLTTAIAYANSAPGLHTVYEVIGADVIARWHRMLGDDTRFLTGTDEHSVNIAQSAEALGITPRQFVDEKVALFRAAEDALLISPDRFIRTTDPDHYRSAQEMVRRAYDNGDIYQASYDGWYCPSEGFKAPSDLHETAKGMQCPNHPDVPLQWLSEKNWFFRLSAYQDRLLDWYDKNPDFVQPDYRRNEMLGFIRQGLQDFSISRAGATWGIPFPVMPDGTLLPAPGRHLGPGRRHDLRLVRRPDQLHHRRGLPRQPGHVPRVVAGGPPRHRQGHRALPHHLLAGDAVVGRARRAEARLGPRLAAGPGRRADEQEPRQLPGPAGRGGGVRGGRRPVRDPARGRLRPRHGGLLGLVRAPLQRGPRQRLRQPRQPHGLDGQPLLRRGAAVAARGRGVAAGRGLGGHAAPVRREAGRPPPPRRAGRALGVRGRRQQDGRCRAAVDAGEAGEGRRCRRRSAAARRAGRPRRGLPAGGPGGRAVHARDGAAGDGAARVRVTRTRPTAMAGRVSWSCWHGAGRLDRAG